MKFCQCGFVTILRIGDLFILVDFSILGKTLNCHTHKFSIACKIGYGVHIIGPGGLRAGCMLAWAMRSLAIVITIVQSFCSPLFFRLLLLTHFGESPVREHLFPQYFGITRRYMQKKVIFIFLRKKADFRARFRNGQRSVMEPGPTPSPWSICFSFNTTNIFYCNCHTPVKV